MKKRVKLRFEVEIGPLVMYPINLSVGFKFMCEMN